MRRLTKAASLFAIGGGLYFVLEIVYRGYSHWTMATLGGFCFLFIGGINNCLPWKMSVLLQAVIGALGVTAAELLAGLFLNHYLGLGIWDYTDQALNIAGQVCLKYSLIWIALSFVGIFLDDWLRFWLFKEERPHYTFF